MAWPPALDDGTDFTGGLNLAESLAYLMGWQCGLEDEPDWLDSFLAAVG